MSAEYEEIPQTSINFIDGIAGNSYSRVDNVRQKKREIYHVTFDNHDVIG